jgi:hypothetical protein
MACSSASAWLNAEADLTGDPGDVLSQRCGPHDAPMANRSATG